MSLLEWLAVAAVLLAIVMIVVELFVPTHGVLAVIGTVLLVLGGAYLLNQAGVGVTDVLLPAIIIIVLLLVVVGGGYAFRLRHMSPLTGAEMMIGKQGQARSDLDPRGFVLVNGEYWSAESEEGSVQEGDAVIITAVNGLSVKVRKLSRKGAPR